MNAPLARSHVCPVTVGRQQEQALIGERLRQATPGTILVAGEAGIGKSRLVGDAMADAIDLGYVVARGHCFDSDAGLPFGPLRELLRSLVDIRSPEEIIQLAGPHAHALGKMVPDLGKAGDIGGAVAAPAEKRERFEAMDRALAGLATQMRLLVIIEDVHWSDGASLEFLLFLARRSVTRPLAMLITYRDDALGPDLAHFLAGLDREHLAVDVPLRGLGPRDVDTMLRYTFHLNRPPPADLIHLLSTLTDGNPYFIEEVLTSMSVAGAGFRPDGRWDPVDPDELRIPRSVQDAVRRRSTTLSVTALRVLELAAVAGARFDLELVGELAALDEQALLDAVKELVAAQLLVEQSAERFAFRHALTRQAVYADILARERRSLHREVAALLERSMSEADDTRLPDLAYHAYAAEAWATARQHSRGAGDQAMALYAPQAAIGHYTRAMEATRRLSLPLEPELWRARGSAHEMLGEFDRALADYETARDLARTTGDSGMEVESLLSLGLLWAARDYDRAGEAIESALSAAREVGDDARIARCLNRLGNWHQNAVRPEESQQCHREALAIVEHLGDLHGIAETRDLLGLSAFFAGDLIQGAEQCSRAIDAWREVGDRHGLSSSLILVSMRGPTLHSDLVPSDTPLAEARTTVVEGLTIARTIGWRAGECWALWMSGGLIGGAEGAYSLAFEELHAALAIAEEIEHLQWTAATHCMLGKIHVDLLDLPRARQHFERALDLARKLGSPYWTQSATAWMASTAIADGDLNGAGALLGDSNDPKPSMTTLSCRLLWYATAELALAQDEPDRALDIVTRLMASAPNASSDRPVARLEMLRGEALTALGATEEAETALHKARDVAAALGARPILWRALIAIDRHYQAQGREADAEVARGAARALIDELAAEVPDDTLRTRFLASATALLPDARKRGTRRDALGLTAREHEVARLLTRGLTNREIAEALYIAEWTAATHVRNILAKLEMTSRTQVAAWAVEHGLGNRVR